MSLTNSLHARTKAFASDHPLKSWWCIFSTTALFALAVAGTFPYFPIVVRVACCGLTALLAVRLFVIYHDHQHRAICTSIFLSAGKEDFCARRTLVFESSEPAHPSAIGTSSSIVFT